MAKKSVWLWVSLALLCVLIVSSYISVYYYMESEKYRRLYEDTLKELEKYSKYMFVNILIDYGNGTQEWYNKTLVPRGSSLLDATRIIAEVDYDKYSWGVFVTAINGKSGDENHGWLWYIWNSTSLQWDFGPVGADAYTLQDGDTVSWVYSSW